MSIQANKKNVSKRLKGEGSMGISVMITHFAPPENTDYCRNILKKTIGSIRNQNVDFDIEIIVCDDGSEWSTKKIAEDTIPHGIIVWEKSKILDTSFLADLDIDKYLYINSGRNYWAIQLKHHAYTVAKYDKVVILDDDHPFRGKKALARYNEYLERYAFVRGRVVGPTGIPQIFRSRNVQGTNYGLRKSLYFRFGGYGKYLFENGFGEDDDIFWQVYKELADNKNKTFLKKACFAGEIVTKDIVSGRYVAQNTMGETIKDSTSLNGNSLPPHVEYFQRNFIETYKIRPGQNLSRDKSLWMEVPSIASWISEIYYAPIYSFKMIPIKFNKKWQRFKKLVEYCKTAGGRKILKERFYNAISGEKT